MTRSYDQFCALAQALDRVGGRWTLLIVRELLVGPARYSALKDALPGISTNLLTERLRDLVGDGLVTKTRLAPPASVDVYELTESGKELGPAVRRLAMWGARYMPGAEYREPPLRGVVLAARAYLLPQATSKLHARVEYDLGLDEPVYVAIRDGDVDIGLGPLSDHDARVVCDPRVFLGMTVGLTRPSSDAFSIAGLARAVATVERAYDRSRELLTSGLPQP